MIRFHQYFLESYTHSYPIYAIATLIQSYPTGPDRIRLAMLWVGFVWVQDSKEIRYRKYKTNRRFDDKMRSVNHWFEAQCNLKALS